MNDSKQQETALDLICQKACEILTISQEIADICADRFIMEGVNNNGNTSRKGID